MNGFFLEFFTFYSNFSNEKIIFTKIYLKTERNNVIFKISSIKCGTFQVNS